MNRKAPFIMVILALIASAATAQTYSEVTIHAFVPAPNGLIPGEAVIQTSDGNLYGTTDSGGAFDAGTVFKISDLGGTPTESVIYSFMGGADGGNPAAFLIQASDGNLYGTTSTGGTGTSCTFGCGTVFRISHLDGNPVQTVIHSFTGGTDGSGPSGPLLQAADGNLYGTTYSGGNTPCPVGCGTVFKISDLGGTLTESGYSPGTWVTKQSGDMGDTWEEDTPREEGRGCPGERRPR